MTAPKPDRPEPGPDAGIDAIEADIEQTREELGQTVEALTHKLDVKEQARQKVDDTKARVVDKADTLRHSATDNPQQAVPIGAIVALVAIGAGILIWRRRRRG
jgi:uncharacterized protein involved in exopolysaccharide biosynthesis